jgi:hypothetical protein
VYRARKLVKNFAPNLIEVIATELFMVLSIVLPDNKRISLISTANLSIFPFYSAIFKTLFQIDLQKCLCPLKISIISILAGLSIQKPIYQPFKG